MKDIMDNFSGKVTSEKVLLLKSSTHQNAVVALPSRRDENLSSWCVPPFGFDEVRYMSSYWEWVEDVLARCKETLDNIKTYDLIIASMFIIIGGLHVHDSFYDKVISSAKEFDT
ncbi:hypothetical protein KY284_032472 [Solanum tuberosum]|nr:hypothetical protein KY284_032472 [Solanum tuberosum]